MARAARDTQETECRQCSTFCDRVIRPASCVQAGCAFLFQYDDPLSGRRYMGCMQKVFAPEIDVEMFEAAERTRLGFGAVKLSRPPLRRCAFEIERAYAGTDAEGGRCVNRRFFDLPDGGPDALRAFDLRSGLMPE
jgi:hypothetical protein